MTKPKFYINNVEVAPPRNWEGIEVSASFDDEQVQSQIDIDKFEFVFDAKDKIKDWFDQSLIFEGVPFRIELRNQDSTLTIFDGIIDLTDGFIMGDVDYTVKVQKRKSNDWLNEIADGYSFRYLEEINVIKNSDFVDIPYIINYIPDYTQSSLLAISIYMMSKELAEVAERIADLASKLAEGLLAPVLFALKLAINLIYFAAISFAISKMVEDLIASLISPKRNHKGIGFKTMLNKGSEHVGLQFSSSIYDSEPYSNLTYLPIKDKVGGSSRETGVPNNTSLINTYGDLLRTAKLMHNADIRIIDNELKLERWDYWVEQSRYVIPDVLIEEKRFNTNELKSNYLVSFEYDQQDVNTLDNFQGTNYQVITYPKIVKNQDNKLLKGLEQVRIPFSLATRKDSLTDVEKTLKSLAEIADTVMGAVGASQNLAGSIRGRVGDMNISSDYVGRPKALLVRGGKMQSDYRTNFSAKKIYNDFHKINSFVVNDGIHNQWILYNQVRIPFYFDDFITLTENNYCKTSDGKVARVDKIEWSFANDYAIIDFRVNEQYTTNLEEQANEPN